VLQDLRTELDQLNEFRRQDITALADAEIGMADMDTFMDDEEMDYDVEEMDFDDVTAFEEQEAVTLAENEDEVAAETMFLPIRAAGDVSDPTNPEATTAPALNIIPPVEDTTTSPTPNKQVRRHKSVRFNKGGAFHAQQFAKSISKSSASRASILDTDWATEKG
jgi:hypothetical protein